MSYREPDLSDLFARIERTEKRLVKLSMAKRLEPIARTALFIVPFVACCVLLGCAELEVFGVVGAWVTASFGCFVTSIVMAAKAAEL